MARSIRSRAPARPGAAEGLTVTSLAEAPLGGTRSEAIRRLQMGAIGVVAVLLLIGLASIIKDRATQTDNSAVAEAAATAAPRTSASAADPLAEAGVVPDMPTSPPEQSIGTAAATSRLEASPAQGAR